MSIRGLSSHWLADIQKMRDKLAGIKAILINRSHKIDALTKEKMVKDIDTVFRLLRKGKTDNIKDI